MDPAEGPGTPRNHTKINTQGRLSPLPPGWLALGRQGSELSSEHSVLSSRFSLAGISALGEPQAQHPPSHALHTGRERLHRAATAVFQLQGDGEGHNGVTEEQ